MRTLALAGWVATMAVVSQSAEGQRLDDARLAARNQPIDVASAPPFNVRVAPADMPGMSKQIMGGVLGGMVGLVAGGYAGFRVETAGGCRPYDDFCGFGGAIVGAALGESIGMGTGVWLGGGRRGSGGAIFASLGLGVVGVLGAAATGGALLPVVPIAQLIGAVVVDRNAAERKTRS